MDPCPIPSVECYKTSCREFHDMPCPNGERCRHGYTKCWKRHDPSGGLYEYFWKFKDMEKRMKDYKVLLEDVESEERKLTAKLAEANAEIGRLKKLLRAPRSDESPEKKSPVVQLSPVVWVCPQCTLHNIKGVHKCFACGETRTVKDDCNICCETKTLVFKCAHKKWSPVVRGDALYKLLPECPPACLDCWNKLRTMSFNPAEQMGMGPGAYDVEIEEKCPCCQSTSLSETGIQMPSTDPSAYWTP